MILLWWKNSTLGSVVPSAMFVLFFEMKKKQELSNGQDLILPQLAHCWIESVKLFSKYSVSLIHLQRVIKVPKLKFWNGCIRTWVEGCLHKVHYLLLSQLFCFFSSQSLKPFFESSLNQLKDQWICETTLKRAVETNACNVSIFLSIAFQPV